MRTARAWMLILAMVMVGAAATGAQGYQYEVVQLPSLSSSSSLYSHPQALGLNDAGQVVGYDRFGPGGDFKAHVLIWENGVPLDLGVPPGFQNGKGWGINNSGQILANADYDPGNGDTIFRPCVWERGGWRNQDLGTLGGQNGIPNKIQRDGTLAVGWAHTATSDVHACIWDLASPAKTDLGTAGGSNSEASGINNLGQVVGYNSMADGTQEVPYLWVPNTTINLALPLPAGFPNAAPANFNRNMVAVGSAYGSGIPTQACAWFVNLNDKTAYVNTINMPLPSKGSWLYAINDHCQAVGQYQTSVGKSRAILARVTPGGGRVVDLNDLIPSGSGWELQNASDINNRGEIIGRGTFNGKYAICLLRPKGLKDKPRFQEVVALGDLGGGSTAPRGLDRKSVV
jgi:probable HAF family extracellular repeat protein